MDPTGWEWQEAGARLAWLAARGGYCAWLSGPEGGGQSRLLARAIGGWSAEGHRVLFADLDVPDATAVLRQLLAGHDRDDDTPLVLWRRLQEAVRSDGGRVLVVLDHADAAPADCRDLLSVLRHAASVEGSGVVLASHGSTGPWTAAVLAAWSDLRLELAPYSLGGQASASEATEPVAA